MNNNGQYEIVLFGGYLGVYGRYNIINYERMKVRKNNKLIIFSAMKKNQDLH